MGVELVTSEGSAVIVSGIWYICMHVRLGSVTVDAVVTD